MEDKLQRVLKEHNLTKEDLTPKELEQLKEELELAENGGTILDGVLSDPSLYYRSLKNKR